MQQNQLHSRFSTVKCDRYQRLEILTYTHEFLTFNILLQIKSEEPKIITKKVFDESKLYQTSINIILNFFKKTGGLLRNILILICDMSI